MSEEAEIDTPPSRFERSHQAAQVREQFGRLGPGEETGVSVSVAGRIMLSRPQGRLAFATLRDETGEVQLFALQSSTKDFEAFTKLVLGDWIGVRGEVMTTKRGELSVKIANWVPLARARRSFGDKWRGVTDVETRFRQREVDLWANERSRQTLNTRHQIVRRLRERLWAQGFTEVETPILHAVPSGGNALRFETHHNALDMDLYLRVAPELYLKRLVVGGLERVFEIGRSFRNEGISPRHNPEFTMMELYQAYADFEDLMTLIEELVAGVARDVLGTAVVTYQGHQLDFTPPWRRAPMGQLIEEATGHHVDVHTPVEELRLLVAEAGVEPDPTWGPGKLLMELYEKTTESGLFGPVFVLDYPVEVSPLARRQSNDPDLVERFEGVVAGRELVNGFSELIDPDDQRARFEEQSAQLAAGDAEAMAVDGDYLRAMEHGLPPTGGLGIGIDRLIMLLTDSANIREVIAFPTLRAGPRR